MLSCYYLEWIKSALIHANSEFWAHAPRGPPGQIFNFSNYLEKKSGGKTLGTRKDDSWKSVKCKYFCVFFCYYLEWIKSDLIHANSECRACTPRGPPGQIFNFSVYLKEKNLRGTLGTRKDYFRKEILINSCNSCIQQSQAFWLTADFFFFKYLLEVLIKLFTLFAICRP